MPYPSLTPETANIRSCRRQHGPEDAVSGDDLASVRGLRWITGAVPGIGLDWFLSGSRSALLLFCRVVWREVRPPELPERIIGGWPTGKVPNRWPGGGEVLPGDVHEVVTAPVDRVTQHKPASFWDPATLDLLVNRPHLGVDGQRRLDNRMVSDQSDHREGFVPCLPVDGRGYTSPVRSGLDWLPGHSVEFDEHVGRLT